MSTIYNLNSGPAILPKDVLEEAARAVIELGNSGLSVLEVSHRGGDYEALHIQAQKDLLELMGLSGDDYAVLFMTGGASTQFPLIPMNFLSADGHADYVNTGEWASRAIVEARRYGTVHVVGSSEDQNFNYIPRDCRFHDDAAYVHLTSNNTIFGTAWNVLPDTGKAPLICDMSSDFLSKPMDFNRFDLVYAGAQKNAGPAGVTVVVIRRSFAEKGAKDLPTMFSYRTHLKHGSLYNTPPVFPIFVTGLMMKWIKRQGGLAAMEVRNQGKAAALYRALDGLSPLFAPTVARPEDRSPMNITFRLSSTELEARFLKEADAAGFKGLKGHRSVGGCRASIYNAFPEEGVTALVDFMHDFARRVG
jgi:phosphoserine aminotransferase